MRRKLRGTDACSYGDGNGGSVRLASSRMLRSNRNPLHTATRFQARCLSISTPHPAFDRGQIIGPQQTNTHALTCAQTCILLFLFTIGVDSDESDSALILTIHLWAETEGIFPFLSRHLGRVENSAVHERTALAPDEHAHEQHQCIARTAGPTRTGRARRTKRTTA